LYGYVEAALKALLGVSAWSRLSGAGVVTEALREMFWNMPQELAGPFFEMTTHHQCPKTKGSRSYSPTSLFYEDRNTPKKVDDT
jgi:hypothetical protein